MITIRQSIETLSIILLGTVLALFVSIQKNKIKLNNSSFSSLSKPVIVSPLPTEIPEGPVQSIMNSPEGKKTLILEKLGNIYTLFISSNPDGQKEQLFKTEEPISQTLGVPFNTWSPNNVYVFLQERTPLMDDYLVFQSSGAQFPNNVYYLSIQELFKKKVKNYVIEEVTGWADSTLLIVNTKAIEGEVKVSFWFDVPSQSFIQLGTYFK